MNFFDHQSKAKKKTGLLASFFLFALFGASSLVYLTIKVGIEFNQDSATPLSDRLWDPVLFMWISLSVLALIVFSSLFKMIQFRRGGGASVAIDMGARHALRRNRKESTLLNIVEEISVASGVPVPPVFVMDEPGINAFAAGYGQEDAIVCVTTGALDKLSRDELQGVVAHEFSHIFNGDMRMNMSLSSLIFGIMALTVLGKILIHASGTGDKKAFQIVILGFVFILIGSVSAFFGKLIQLAVSRQREFLADATAVQYTRNPDGISNALKKIAGHSSLISSSSAGAHAHMFFGDVGGVRSFFSKLMATHPPLGQRISRIKGVSYDKSYDAPHQDSGCDGMSMSLAGGAAAGIQAAHMNIDSVPCELLPEDAPSCVDIAVAMAGHTVDGMPVIKDRWRLPLTNHIISRVREENDLALYRCMRTKIIEAIKEDGKVTMKEFAYSRVVIRSLDRHFGLRRVTPNKSVRINNAHLLTILKFSSPEGWRSVADDLGEGSPLDYRAVSDAFSHIEELRESDQGFVLDRCVSAIMNDGKSDYDEREALMAICITMGVGYPLK